jgi:DNA-binding FadR family transcriptional regulator
VAKKVPLKRLFESVWEAQKAATEIVVKAAGLYGVISEHCRMLEVIRPEAAAGVRKLADKYWAEIQEAMDRLNEL